jgi:hypothetical protein
MWRRAAVWTLALLAGPMAVHAQSVVPAGPEFPVNTYTTQAQGYASVAAHPGGFVVAWESNGQDGSGHGVVARRYDAAGAPLGPEFVVNAYTVGGQSLPAAGAAADGSFVVVWNGLGQDGSYHGIFGRRFDGAGQPLGDEFRVNTYTTSNQVGPSVSRDGSGGFVVVWQSLAQDGNLWGVFGQRYDAEGTALGGEFRVNSYTPGNQYEPSVAADDAGGFVVVWTSYGQTGPATSVFAQRYDVSGAPLGQEFRVDTSAAPYAFEPKVGGNGTGSFVVTWTGFSPLGGGYEVFARRYDTTGGALGAEFQVNTYTSYTQSSPAIALDATGAFVVAWNSVAFQDGSGDAVLAQAFDASGMPAGAEFQVNTYSLMDQRRPAIASGSTENFVVAWTSDGQDGSGTGIFGQRLGPDLIFGDGFEG